MSRGQQSTTRPDNSTPVTRQVTTEQQQYHKTTDLGTPEERNSSPTFTKTVRSAYCKRVPEHGKILAALGQGRGTSQSLRVPPGRNPTRLFFQQFWHEHALDQGVALSPLVRAVADNVAVHN